MTCQSTRDSADCRDAPNTHTGPREMPGCQEQQLQGDGWLGKGKEKESWKPKDEGHNERASLQALFAG